LIPNSALKIRASRGLKRFPGGLMSMAANAPFTQKEGPGYVDPSYDLSVE
jgi:hypothetical protein